MKVYYWIGIIILAGLCGFLGAAIHGVFYGDPPTRPPVTQYESNANVAPASIITSAKTGPLSLAEAMRQAAASLQPPPAKSRSTALQREEAYRQLLAAGEPIVLSRKNMRPITIAFAHRLSDADRDRWLHKCLLLTTSGSPAFLEARSAMVSRHFRNSKRAPFWNSRDVYAAVFNLAVDPGLRAQAVALANTDEAERVIESIPDWSDCVRRDGLCSPPYFRGLQMWPEMQAPAHPSVAAPPQGVP